MKSIFFHLKWAFALSFIILHSVVTFSQQAKEVSKYGNQKELTSTGSIILKSGFVVPSGASFRAYISSGYGQANNTMISPNMNTIATYTVRVPGIVDPADPQNHVNQVNVEVQTLDHFGRVAERQQIKSTPRFQDIVQYHHYDGLGREALKYSPYVQQTGRANFADKGYPIFGYSYYDQLNAIRTPSIAPSNGLSGAERYDDSPLNRVLEIADAGEDVRTNYGHSVRTTLQWTQDTVWRYTGYGGYAPSVDPTKPKYSDGTFTVTKIESENVDGDDGAVYEYRNKEGQLLLKRVIRLNGYVRERHSTYYVYDEVGNLLAVLPPNANPDNPASITTTTANELCYLYQYDNSRRMIAKKLPGKGWEYMVYNKLNQVVLTQDAEQRHKSPQQWSYNKYDGQGRAVVTGIYTHAGSTADTDYRDQMQSAVNNASAQWESRTTTGVGYTSNTYPTTGLTPLTISYFDDYNFPGGNPYPNSGLEISTMTRGLLTGTKTNVLGTANMLWTVNYYDEDGRIAKTYKQHYKGASLLAGNVDEVNYTYDFTGSLLTSTRVHKVNGLQQLKVENEYQYDHVGRKTHTWQRMNSDPKILLSKMEYDDLGQLYKKKLHSINGSTFLDSVTYFYNKRGWLARAQSNKLDFKLRYDAPTKGANLQYNGNISEIEYTGERSGNRWFTYSYDKLDRLVNSDYSDGDLLNESLTYDSAGNIKSMIRGASSSNQINYAYANGGSSNRLNSVSGFVSGAFTYDLNGNAKSDGTRSVSNINYNHLNLPISVTKGAETASYIYDADGSKLRSVQAGFVTDYIDGIHYTNNTLNFVATDEGRAVLQGSGKYKYEYNLRDHLGNVRVSIDSAAGGSRVIQENEYYAFGLNVQKGAVSGDKNNYLYNGKELQGVLSNEYDYGARFYDPVIGRWHVMDPLAEKYYELSAYNYTENSPISNIDPDGRESYHYTGEAAQALFGYLQSLPYNPPQDDRGRDTDHWGRRAKVAIGMFTQWLTGGFGMSNYLQFENDEIADALRNSDGVDRARKFFYEKYKNASTLKGASVSNYAAKFGFEQLIKAGVDPIEQFVGSFRVNIVYNEKSETLEYSIKNTTSMTSAFYHASPSYDSGGPMSNMYQTYKFSEKVDNTKLKK